MDRSKAAKSFDLKGVRCWCVEGDGRLRTPGGDIFSSLYAEVAKLAGALDSGSSARKGVRVQIPASAPPFPFAPIKWFQRFNPLNCGIDRPRFGGRFG